MTSTSSEFLPVRVAQGWCNTKREVTKVTFQWNISDFKHIVMAPGQFLESSQFSSKHDDEFKWFLRLYPYGSSGSKSLSLSLNLHCCCGDKQVTAKHKVEIANKHVKWFKESDQKTYSKSSDYSEFVDFIKRDVLLNELNGYIPDNKLQLYCEINVISGPVTVSGRHDNLDQEVEKADLYLSQKFAKLFESQELSDVTLKVKGKEIRAHKAVLASSSEAFSAMFKHQMSEQESDVVYITDVEYNAMFELVRFLYTGKTHSLNEAEELLVAANKYDIGPLKMVCEAHLASKLTTDNFGHLLVLSDMHNAENLRDVASTFAALHSNEVLETENWKFLEAHCPHIVTEVFKKNLMYR